MRFRMGRCPPAGRVQARPDAARRGLVTRSTVKFQSTAATDLREDARHHRGGHTTMPGVDVLFLERLVIGGLLAALAVVVAFGPELRRALVRLRHRAPEDRRPIGIEPTPS
jgi:hypothetical protein